jgi:predicted small secreted protein
MAKNILMALATLAVLAGTVPLLTACNTTAGAGKDIEAAGDAIQDTAEDNKSY